MKSSEYVVLWAYWISFQSALDPYNILQTHLLALAPQPRSFLPGPNGIFGAQTGTLLNKWNCLVLGCSPPQTALDVPKKSEQSAVRNEVCASVVIPGSIWRAISWQVPCRFCFLRFREFLRAKGKGPKEREQDAVAVHFFQCFQASKSQDWSHVPFLRRLFLYRSLFS